MFLPFFDELSTENNGSVGSFKFFFALNDVPQGVTVVSGSSSGGGESPPPPDGGGDGSDLGGGGGVEPPLLSPNLPQEDGGIFCIASLYDLE